MVVVVRRTGRKATIEGVVEVPLAKALWRHLSFERHGSRFMPNPEWAWVRFYNLKKNSFPFGLIDRAETVLKKWREEKGEEYVIHGRSECVADVDAFKEGLRPYQLEAINALIKNGGGVVSIPTGGGKTLMAIRLMQMMNVKQAVVFVPTVDLVTQWQAELAAHALADRVQAITYAGASRKDGRTFGTADFVAFDEVHHVAARTVYRTAMFCENAVMIGVSATPYRSDGEEMRIEAAIGRTVYRCEVADLTAQGFLCKAEVVIFPVGKVALSPFDEYADVYDKAVVENAERNSIIVREAVQRVKHGPVLILVDRKAHGEKLLKFLGAALPPERLVFVTGETKRRKEVLKDASDGKYDVLLATTGVYGEGVNLPVLRTLIMACGGRSSVGVVQRTGRLLRTHRDKELVTIVDFDDTARFVAGHATRRKHIYIQIFGEGALCQNKQ